MNALMEAVRAGRTAEVVYVLGGMPDAERRACLPELRALRKELRAAPWEGTARRVHPALHAAGAACHTGAAAAASWIAASDMRWSPASPKVLLRVLEGRDNGWLADVANRLAQRPATADVPYELVCGLVHRSGCDVPATDAYVRGWVGHIAATRRGDSVMERLRGEPDLVPLVAALFELGDLRGIGWMFGEGPGSWQAALAELTRAGTLDRRTMVDACVARLLRGGGPSDHRVFLPLLVRLELTPDEQRARAADWTALARDAVSPVASHAQSVLAALALDGELTPRQLAEASEGVLFRGEKKLVRAQLVLLGKALSRDPSAAAELLPVAAQAFGHEDSQLQERALKLVERHAGRLDTTTARDEIARHAEQLSPALRGRASGALGIAEIRRAPAVYEEVLPPVPAPVRLAPVPESAVELAEETGALLASDGDVGAFERALDGLVRHAYRDRDALLEALEPVIERRWWDTVAAEHRYHTESYFGARQGFPDARYGLDLLLVTLRGKVSTATLHTAARHGAADCPCVHSALSRPFEARLREVAHRLRADPLPLLLSTPTWSTGAIEPDELVERLGTYGRLGARVSGADFAQALLRVRRTDRAAPAAARAAALGTPEGTRLARWLASPDPALPSYRREASGARILLEVGEILVFQEDFPPAFQRLGRPVTSSGERRYCSHWSQDLHRHWPAVLPERRELVAARLVHDLSRAATDDTRGPAATLSLLAESGGEAGESVHLCLAYGLGARHAEDRLAAVDALLVLAARGQLDPARLGADLGQLVRRGAVKPVRLAESARSAAATGANATIWSILRHALPVLLADLATSGPAGALPARGLGDLLAVAADCAERTGACDPVPHLDRIAARRGSSRLIGEARRLRGALVTEAAA
ncbi:DUF6493 family protein [Streptomyces sp. NPDC001480]|uniref:DUF7824 domain-containing protein n=1 Tax=Streptomyces sp. NPDC001480 TaxID=3364577 RepID=UPI0036BD5468